jgi:hypothetical protein
MLADYEQIDAKFRSADFTNNTITVRIEYSHPTKEAKEKYDHAKHHYKNEIHRLEGDLHRHERDLAGTPVRDVRRRAEINTRIQQVYQEKKRADQQFYDATKDLPMEKDFIDYELRVMNEAPIRKMFLPKQTDENGKPKEYTAAEKKKLRGDNPNPKNSYSATLDEFFPDTPVRLKIDSPQALKDTPVETGNSETQANPPTTPSATPPPQPDPNAPKPPRKRDELPLAERPVVKMVTALADPNEPPPPPEKAKKKTY